MSVNKKSDLMIFFNIEFFWHRNKKIKTLKNNENNNKCIINIMNNYRKDVKQNILNQQFQIINIKLLYLKDKSKI